MRPFAFSAPASVAEAVALLAADPGGARLIAGGSDLLGELKEGTASAGHLVSLERIAALREVRAAAGGLHLGAAVTLARLEREPLLAGPYALLAEAARGVATPEIRNQGTLGGNLCQRPRCLHYRSHWLDCLKKGGTECPAAQSTHQPYLAVFGARGCHAVHASDLAPPLLALGASVQAQGPRGERTLPLAAFFAGPERDVRRENVLAPDEVLTTVLLPPVAPGWRGTYQKARERTAGDFPLVSAAFGARLDAGRVREARLVLGGVAHVPWPCAEAVALLEGQAPTAALARQAAAAAFAGAQPLAHNGYKLDLGRALVERAILTVLQP
jgi:xanthine dehydrogenase YagS FAD-binding subunit